MCTTRWYTESSWRSHAQCAFYRQGQGPQDGGTGLTARFLSPGCHKYLSFADQLLHRRRAEVFLNPHDDLRRIVLGVRFPKRSQDNLANPVCITVRCGTYGPFSAHSEYLASRL